MDIEVFPYLRDHRFEGKAVFPAVEAMQVLAAAVRKTVPRAGVLAIRDARFDKFLYIPADAARVEAFADIEHLSNGRVKAALITRHRAPKTGITRVKEHACLVFGGNAPLEETPSLQRPDLPADGFEIPADALYAEMVPFAPAYHNIQERARMWPSGAEARVLAARHQTPPGPLGSPFPLDAAFHTACAWGQRYAGVVAFPVGLDCRRILRPTRPGERYLAVVVPRRTTPDLLVFDMALYDRAGGLCERVLGVRMRDVSAGRMKPPKWVLA